MTVPGGDGPFNRSSPERRRFPPPWSIEETAACFIVKDSDGQPLAYVYFEDEPGRQSAVNLLMRGECRHQNSIGFTNEAGFSSDASFCSSAMAISMASIVRWVLMN